MDTDTKSNEDFILDEYRDRADAALRLFCAREDDGKGLPNPFKGHYSGASCAYATDGRRAICIRDPFGRDLFTAYAESKCGKLVSELLRCPTGDVVNVDQEMVLLAAEIALGVCRRESGWPKAEEDEDGDAYVDDPAERTAVSFAEGGFFNAGYIADAFRAFRIVGAGVALVEFLPWENYGYLRLGSADDCVSAIVVGIRAGIFEDDWTVVDASTRRTVDWDWLRVHGRV